MTKIEVPPGKDIFQCCIYAIETAINYDEKVTFTFNEIEVSAYPESFANDIAEKYLLLHQIRRLKAGYRD